MKKEENEYFQSQEFRVVLAEYENARKNGSNIYMDADDLTDIAEYYMTENREKDANTAISLAMTLHPESTSPKVFLARQKMFHGELDMADKLARSIKEQNEPEVLYARAEIMVRKGMVNEASMHLANAIDNWNDDPEERCHYLKDCTEIFMDYEQWGVALKWCLMTLKDYPEDLEIKEFYLETLLELEHCTEAIEVANEILDADSYRATVWHMLADAQTHEHEFEAALESIEFGLAVDPEEDTLVHAKGVCLIQLERFAEANVTLREYLEKHPEDDHALYNRAIALTCMENYEGATVLLDKATEVSQGMSSEQTQIYLQQAFVEAKMGHVDQAMQALDMAKQVQTPDDELEYEALKKEIMKICNI